MKPAGDTELSEMRALAEALADVLLERGLIVAGPPSAVRIIDASQVGAVLGRDRRWVYAHADELGGFRYGDGPKARLGFDLNAVERWKRERQARSMQRRGAPDGRPSRGLVTDGGANLIPYEP
ncbi:MAG: hypothetical protein LC790_13440 [Actinobacteria bacterium]|nr:hypothetical protein [Actinomycetota bacterium]